MRCVTVSTLAVIAFVVVLTHAQCDSSVVLSTWRAANEDGTVQAVVYSGYGLKMIPLRVQWHRLPEAVSGRIHGSILFPKKHPFLELDAPTGWFDGRSVLTLETLTFVSRKHAFTWPISSLNMTLPNNQAILYLAPDSAIWLTYDAVVFTGTQLHFILQRPGRLCPIASAIPASSRMRLLYADGETPHAFTVYRQDSDPFSHPRMSGNVTLRVDFESPQSLLPQSIAASLSSNDIYHLHLSPGVDFTSGEQIRDAIVATGVPGNANNQIVIGRRSLLQLASAWAINSQGHVALWVTSSESDNVPMAIYWVSGIISMFLVVVVAYWISYMGHTLRLQYIPTLHQRRHADEHEVTLTHLILAWFVMPASLIAHVFMLLYGAHGTLASSSFEDPLNQVILWQGIGSLVSCLVFLGMLIGQTIYVITHWYEPNDPDAEDIFMEELDENNKIKPCCGYPSKVSWYNSIKPIPIQLFGILLGISAGRGLVAAFLVSAGTHLALLFMTFLAALAFAFFPSIYGFAILATHLFARVRLYRMPRGSQWYTLAIVLCALCLFLSILVGVTFAIWVIQPWLDAMNAMYSPLLITAVTLFFIAAPIALVCYSLGEQQLLLLRPTTTTKNKKQS